MPRYNSPRDAARAAGTWFDMKAPGSEAEGAYLYTEDVIPGDDDPYPDSKRLKYWLLIHTAEGWQKKSATLGLFARLRKQSAKDKEVRHVTDVIADALVDAQGSPIWVKIVRWGEKLTTEYVVTITKPPPELMAAGLADAVAQATADAPQEQDQGEYIPPPDEP